MMVMHLNEDHEDEFEKEWWYSKPKLRAIFAPILYATSWQYRLWRFLQKSPEERKKKTEAQARKIRERTDYPKVNGSDIVGRSNDLERVMLSAYYHIFRDRDVRATCHSPPPKVFVVKGESGTGKTAFCEALLHEAFEAGLRYGLLLHYRRLRPEDVYTMWYGRSAQRLSEFFEEAFKRPSMIFIDEFHAFGKRFTSTSEVGMEETRVQTVFLEKIDELQKKNYRCVLAIATNEYEALAETLRRRGLVGTIDLDTGVNVAMLTEIAKRQCDKYHINLDPGLIVETLEDSLRMMGDTKLTPADIVSAFEIVLNAKSIKLQKRVLSRSGSSEASGIGHISDPVTVNDFRAAAKKLKAYSAGEKTEAAKKSIVRIAPAERYRDVGGLHHIKDEVVKEISLALDTELAARTRYVPPKGFIFAGPPGTGKTLLAKAIAGESGVWFYSINGPSILQGHYGDPEKTIRDIFSDARKNAPAIVFFDEIDSVAPRRGMHDPVVDRVTSQLLTEIDGFTPLSGVVVIATTNRIDILDPALLERFTRHFNFTYPKSKDEKLEIIEIHMRRYRDCLEAGVTPREVLKVFEKKALSPRKIADAIDDANRLRTKELEVCRQLLRIDRDDPEKLRQIQEIFKPDLERLFQVLEIAHDDPKLVERLKNVNPSNYPLRLFHFKQALEGLVDESVEEARRLQRTVRLQRPEVGRSYGLVGLGELGEAGGFVGVIEVVVNPNGSGKVHVIGSEAGESISASAQDAFVYLNSISNWRFKSYDVFVELVTPAKGMEKQVVAPGIVRPSLAGPSAGLGIGIAMLSAFTGLKVDPTIVMTGAITARGEVWPVGGLDHRGMGKIEAALADEYARKLLIPKYNYERLAEFDIESILSERSIKLIPVQAFLEAASEAIVGNPSEMKILEMLNACT
jgi:SpoVK/Ycf46/Vps4 family AAA+-type ATPase